MKTTKSFSIESEVLRVFFDTCENKKLNHNAVIEVLLKTWVKDAELMSVKLIICPDCGAEYSEILNRCPNCVNQQVTSMLDNQQNLTEYSLNKAKSEEAYEKVMAEKQSELNKNEEIEISKKQAIYLECLRKGMQREDAKVMAGLPLNEAERLYITNKEKAKP